MKYVIALFFGLALAGCTPHQGDVKGAGMGTAYEVDRVEPISEDACPTGQDRAGYC